MRMDPYYTQEHVGMMKYHTFANDTWYGVGGIENHICQLILARIKDEVEFLDEYELFVHGGILENWLTWDMDLYFIGPYEPEKIKSILSAITKIGFDEQLFCDVSYRQGGLFDHYDISKEDKSKCYFSRHLEIIREMRAKGIATEIYYLSNYCILEDEVVELTYTELPNGLFRKGSKTNTESWAKHEERLSTGHKYKWPLKIN
tara:strand:- start:250 stop:858 length:609 start_codon:yes stop_codon:yes gene_type:complete